MKLNKIIVSMFLACSLTAGLYAQEAELETPDFGSVNFGDSVQTVKAAEKDTKLLLEKPEYLIYEEESEGTKSQNVYEFNEGKLNVGMINIVSEHESLGEIIDEYNKLNEVFKQVYGEPTDEAVNVQDDALLNDKEKLAKAVQDGTATFSTVWSKDNFTVVHTLIDSLPTEDLDEDTQKILVKAPLCHLVIATASTDESDVEPGENEEPEEANEAATTEEKAAEEAPAQATEEAK